MLGGGNRTEPMAAVVPDFVESGGGGGGGKDSKLTISFPP